MSDAVVCNPTDSPVEPGTIVYTTEPGVRIFWAGNINGSPRTSIEHTYITECEKLWLEKKN